MQCQSEGVKCKLLCACRCDALAVFQETVDNSEAQSKACEFLVSKQRHDGGWAESYLSSQTKVRLPNTYLVPDLACLQIGGKMMVISG